MQRDPRLEDISDKIRGGVPVSMREAIEAIDYQERLKASTPKSIWQKLRIRLGLKP